MVRSPMDICVARTQWVKCVEMAHQAYLKLHIVLISHYGIWNHRQLYCFISRLFRLTTKKQLQLCLVGHLWWESTCGSVSHRASNAENNSIVWQRHVIIHQHKHVNISHMHSLFVYTLHRRVLSLLKFIHGIDILWIATDRTIITRVTSQNTCVHCQPLNGPVPTNALTSKVAMILESFVDRMKWLKFLSW